jgi:DNA-binding NarL/FixJ family response regulator
MPRRDLRREPLRLLVVVEDTMLAATLRSFLDDDERLTVLEATQSFRGAVVAAVSLPVEVALVDVRLSGEDGYAVVDAIRNLEPTIVAILMGSVDSIAVLDRAATVGATAVIQEHDLFARGIDTIITAYEDGQSARRKYA